MAAATGSRSCGAGPDQCSCIFPSSSGTQTRGARYESDPPTSAPSPATSLVNISTGLHPSALATAMNSSTSRRLATLVLGNKGLRPPKLLGHLTLCEAGRSTRRHQKLAQRHMLGTMDCFAHAAPHWDDERRKLIPKQDYPK